LTREWLIAAAKEMQLNLVEAKTVAGQADRLAARDNLTGNQRQAEWRRAGIPTDVDFVIEGIVRAKSNVDEYGGAKFTSVTLAVDLRAVRADTGAVLAALPMKTIQLRSDLAAPDLAAREKLHLVLDGKPGTEYLGAWPLFRHIFAAWLTELDLGAMVRLELAGLGDADHDRLLKTLGETDKINAVFPREFDSQGLSFVDVETRLDAGALKAVVLQTLGGGWRLDRTTKHYLQFRRGTTGNHEIHETHESRSTATNGLPSWLWALIGAGAVALLGGVFLLGKRRGGG
jgi:hypothetical protein